MPTYNDVFCHHLGRYAHRFKQAAKPFLAKYEITDLLCTKLESNGSIIHFPIMTGTKTESWLSTDIQNNAVRRSFQNALKIPTKMLSTDLQQLVQEKNSTESIAKLYQYHHDVYCQSIYKLSGIWLVSIGTKHKSSLYQFFEIDADLEVLIMALDNLLETQPAIRQHMNVAGEVRPLNITSPIVGDNGLNTFYQLRPATARVWAAMYAGASSSQDLSEILFLSKRTVEGYIEELKAIFQCKTKLDLFQDIRNRPQLMRHILQQLLTKKHRLLVK